VRVGRALPTSCKNAYQNDLLASKEIPAKVAADQKYQNTQRNSDKQNARIEHDKALGRVMNGVLKDDTERFKQFSDNGSFRCWLSDTVGEITLDWDTLTSTADSDQQLIVLIAEPGTPSDQALRILASWAANPREPRHTSPS
jgi:hypothetical protein